MNGIEFEVTGRKGLFTCPEFKVGGENVLYRYQHMKH